MSSIPTMQEIINLYLYGTKEVPTDLLNEDIVNRPSERANQGVDSIDNAGGGTDTINFADINDSQLSYHKDGNDLVILVDKDLAQQVRVKNHFVTTADNAIDTITTKNGVTITAAMIATKLTALPGKEDMSGDNVLKDTLGNVNCTGIVGDPKL